jgi:hypothetical protein
MDEMALEQAYENLRRSRYGSEEWTETMEAIEKHFKPTEEEIRLRTED